MHCTLEENEMLKTNSNGKCTRIGNLYTNPQYKLMQRKKSQQNLLNWDKVLLSDLKIIFLGKERKTPGRVLPRILDRGVPRRFMNPNPI